MKKKTVELKNQEFVEQISETKMVIDKSLMCEVFRDGVIYLKDAKTYELLKTKEINRNNIYEELIKYTNYWSEIYKEKYLSG